MADYKFKLITQKKRDKCWVFRRQDNDWPDGTKIDAAAAIVTDLKRQKREDPRKSCRLVWEIASLWS